MNYDLLGAVPRRQIHMWYSQSCVLEVVKFAEDACFLCEGVRWRPHCDYNVWWCTQSWSVKSYRFGANRFFSSRRMSVAATRYSDALARAIPSLAPARIRCTIRHRTLNRQPHDVHRRRPAFLAGSGYSSTVVTCRMLQCRVMNGTLRRLRREYLSRI